MQNKEQIINTIIKPIFIIGIICGALFRPKLFTLMHLIKSKYYSGLYSIKVKKFGKYSTISKLEEYLNLDNVSIGDNTHIEKGALIRCYVNDSNKIGEIFIGNNVNIGINANISACNGITIQDSVLIGRNVMINDNSHGYTHDRGNLFTPPIKRPIVSKGKIVIEKNVWLGENVVVLGNVRIGAGSIIGANSVVCKDIPSYTVAAGCPAKVIKTL